MPSVRLVYENEPRILRGEFPLNRSKFSHWLAADVSILVHNPWMGMRLAMNHEEAAVYLFEKKYNTMLLQVSSAPFIPLNIRLYFDELYESLSLGLLAPFEAAARLQNRVTLEILEGN